MKTTTPWRDACVLSTLAVAELVCARWAASVISRDTTYLYYVGGFLAMALCWLAGSYFVMTHARDTRANRLIIVSAAIAMRALMLPTDPTLSDDIFRYVWDGRVQHAGINPYVFAPDAEALVPLREDATAEPNIFAGINNKEIPTIYPPFMQIAFFAVTALSEDIVWMKAMFVGADLAIILVLAKLLGSLGLHRTRVLLYAWSPLVIFEVAGSGHNDALAVLALMAALLAIVHHRSHLTMALMTLSGLGKLLGFALMPLLARAVPRRSFVVVPAVTAALSWPYLGAGGLAFVGITEYGTRWRGNDGLFHILFAVTGSLDAAKLVVAVVLIALVVALVSLDANPLRSSYLTVGAVLLLMPTVHPWYLLWIAPFLAIYPSPAWLFLTTSIVLGYHSAYLSMPGQPWEDVSWVKLLEYAPFFALAGASLRRRAHGGRQACREFLGLESRP